MQCASRLVTCCIWPHFVACQNESQMYAASCFQEAEMRPREVKQKLWTRFRKKVGQDNEILVATCAATPWQRSLSSLLGTESPTLFIQSLASLAAAHC